MSGEGEGELAGCESVSNEFCGCLDWRSFEAMAARSKMVSDGTCVVLQQGPPLGGVEAGALLGLGFLAGWFICWLR